MSAQRIIALVVAVTIVLIGYRYWSNGNVQPEGIEVPDVASPAVIPAEMPDEEPATENVEPIPVDQAACLTLKQFEEVPGLVQDAARMESVAASGAVLDAFRGLDDAALQSYAEQGDSAAMLVMGANAVMRAFGKNQSLAIEWLNHRERISDLDLGNSELTPAASLALNDAAYWFYEAASHGRLLALQNYGQVRGRLFGGPVGLGWVGQEEYDALSAGEKTSLVPANLYAQLAYDIAPALREGALGDLTRMVPESSIQQDVRRNLATEFAETLAASGLPPISVAPTATLDVDVLFDQLCESDKEEVLRRHGLE